jgi:DNA-binding NarL/FixJ family response regulator
MESARQEAPLMVFLVEDSLPIRARLAATIRGIDGAELVGEAGNVGAAIAGIRSTHPGALILDLQLEDGSGLDVLKAVHPSTSALHVAVLTNYATDQHRRACMDAGAEYFLDKSSDFPRIREIVQGWTHRPDGAAPGQEMQMQIRL